MYISLQCIGYLSQELEQIVRSCAKLTTKIVDIVIQTECIDSIWRLTKKDVSRQRARAKFEIE